MKKKPAKKARKAGHKHWWTAWRPLGNGQPLYNRECCECGEFQGRDLALTGEESVQLATGGFRLVKSKRKVVLSPQDNYKRLCGEIWDALGVPPDRQEGDPTGKLMQVLQAARAVVASYLGKDKPGWAPSQMREAVARLMPMVQ